MLEREVAAAVREFLADRGWRIIRNNAVSFAGVGSEPGIPDYLALRYQGAHVALHLWIEVKSPKARRECQCRPGKILKSGKAGKARKCRWCAQDAWQTRERERGGTVIVVRSVAELEEAYARAFGWLDGKKNAQIRGAASC